MKIVPEWEEEALGKALLDIQYHVERAYQSAKLGNKVSVLSSLEHLRLVLDNMLR